VLLPLVTVPCSLADLKKKERVFFLSQQQRNKGSIKSVGNDWWRAVERNWLVAAKRSQILFWISKEKERKHKWKAFFVLVTIKGLVATLSNCREVLQKKKKKKKGHWYRPSTERSCLLAPRGKLVGKVRIQWIEIIGSQVLKALLLWSKKKEKKSSWMQFTD